MFKFPQTLEKIQISDSVNNLQQILLAQYKSMVVNEKICPKFPFAFRSIIMKKIIYARAKCLFCSSFLAWRQKEEKGPLHLHKYVIEHDHQKEQKNAKNNLKNKVMSYLQTINIPSELTTLNEHIVEVFNVSIKYAEKLTALWYGKWGKDLKEISNNLKQKGISFNYWPPLAQKIPQVTVIITPHMRKMYSQYGFSIKLDFTYKVIRDKAEVVSERSDGFLRTERKSLLLGLISGVTSYNKIVVFGIAIVSGENSFNIRKSLEYFFNFMGEECEAIITDQARGMEGAISSMNEDFFEQKVLHLLDQYHVIHNLKFGKRQEDFIKYKLSSKILKSRTVPEFNYHCSLLQKELKQNQRQQLQKLKHLACRCCMAMIEASGFIGPNISTSSSQSLNNLIKHKIKFSLSYLSLIPRIIDICSNINRRAVKQPKFMKFELQKFCPIQDIGAMCKILPKSIIEIILANLLSARHMNVVDEQRDRIVISEFGETTTLVRVGESQIWKCPCLYLNRSGLPCPHLMKVLKRIGPYIHEFWNVNTNAVKKQRIGKQQ